MYDIQELRKEAGLTQGEAARMCDLKIGTYGSYERGERSPDYETGKKIRQELAEAAGLCEPIQSKHLYSVEVTPAAAGPGEDIGEDATEMYLDERFLRGTNVELGDAEFFRVVGSGLEPALSHAQVIGVDPCERVLGDDLYVYHCSHCDGHVVAIVRSVRGGLEIRTRGPTPRADYVEHVEGRTYVDDQGRESTLTMQGRVVAATCNPSQMLSLQNEAARHAAPQNENNHSNVVSGNRIERNIMPQKGEGA